MTRARVAVACAPALAAMLAGARARAGDFDAAGVYHASADAAGYIDFENEPQRFVPVDVDASCLAPGYQLATADDALDGAGFVKLDVTSGCFERFEVDVPAEKRSYRASVWMRHGSLGAQLVATYPESSGQPSAAARMFPTGRMTSDGWVELASNDLPIDGTLAEHVYLRVSNGSDVAGVDVDAFEVMAGGEYLAPQTCAGLADTSCGDERICMYNECVLGRAFVPPLPDDTLRDEVIDLLMSRLLLFFGGKLSRERYLPDAIASIEEMRSAKTAWAFWNAWATAIRKLHDWHTSADSALDGAVGPHGRLNACFIEGEADASYAAWPKDPAYADVLISHAGQGALGLEAGDRLVAVDGMHPLAWASTLTNAPGYHVATDPDNVADFAERLGGPYWAGGATILRYAKSITVIRCDAATQKCSDVVETIQVADIPAEGNDAELACDNRPFYHLENAGEQCLGGACTLPDASTHYVFGDIFRGRVAGTIPDEAIYGMVWDTLYGGGDPQGWVNGNITLASNFWKANARGVILDHRAGNGGTLDAAETMTKLVRPEQAIAVIRMPIEIAGFDGPSDAAEGIAIFQKFATSDNAFVVGDAAYDPALPVALLIHRDGSASDYMPFGMKGAPKVKIFGPPHGTAGAFSTFIEFRWWGGLSFQIASGDTIASDGSALIGHSVLPDVAVLPKQSDLLAGKDTMHEAALAWIRQELKP